MARRVARHDDPIDPVTGDRRWPTWHDDTLHALDRLNRNLQRRWLLVVAGLLIVGVFTYMAIGRATSAADKANDAARSAQRTAGAIQHSRYQTFYDECRTTDHRHDATVRRLRHVSRHAPRAPGVSRAQQHRQIAATILLINAILPNVKQCKSFAARHVALPSSPAPRHPPER